jgi:hypothetical protein
VPLLDATEVLGRPSIGIYRFEEHADEAVNSAVRAWSTTYARQQGSMSFFWLNRARFDEARGRLGQTARLSRGWDTYGGDPPNNLARAIAASVLTALEAEALPPARLLPSVEGGIAITFVEENGRAEIEIYNSGEIAAAAYARTEDPTAWEFEANEDGIKDAINRIREHLFS